MQIQHSTDLSTHQDVKKPNSRDRYKIVHWQFHSTCHNQSCHKMG